MPYFRKILLAVLLAIVTWSGNEVIALATPPPTVEQQKAAALNGMKAQSSIDLNCAAAKVARSQKRHYFALSEARACAPGGSVVAAGSKLSLDTRMQRHALLYIDHGAGQFSILQADFQPNPMPARSASAYCYNSGAWFTGQWFTDVWVGNKTDYVLYCGSGSQGYVAWGLAYCNSVWPFAGCGDSYSHWGDWSSSIYSIATVTACSWVGCATGDDIQHFQYITSGGGWWSFSSWS
jgi:hypothetical protein